MAVDDNEIDEVEPPQRSFSYNNDSPSNNAYYIPKDVTHLSVQQQVPRIEKLTFSRLPFLVEVQLHEGLQFIGEGAFCKCFMLKTIVVPSTVETIEAFAFAECESLVNARLICEGGCFLKTLGKNSFAGCIKLEQMSVPSTVEIICRGTFKLCTALVEVELKEEGSLHTIGAQAFFRCESLTAISVPSTVHIIDENAFAFCESLGDVEIPRSVKTLSNFIFKGCKSLSKLPVQRGRNNGITSDPNLPFFIRTIGMEAFRECTTLMQVSLSSTVDKIDEFAFTGCGLLADVELSEGLRYIEQYAFASCVSLCGITIPSTTLKVGQYAFVRCNNLVGVEFSPKCKAKLFQGCFRHCDALATICLPPAVKIGGGISIFMSCLALQEFVGCQGEDLVEFMKERFQTTPPVHKLCYSASQTNVQDLRNAVSIAQDDVRDELGMAPLHIVATASRLRPDLLQVLLDHYPLNHLGWIDKRKNVMMGYLLSNASPNAIPLIKMILQRTILGGMTCWGLD